MDLLALLAAAPMHTFSRQTLDDALWPNVVVGENTLARSISKLRRALGDSPTTPTFVETIPKRGYRLIAPVSSVSHDQACRPDAVTPATTWTRRVLLGAIVSILAAVAFVALQPIRLTTSNPTPAAVRTERAHDLYMAFTRAKNEAAIQLYEEALVIDPSFAPAQAGLANALVQRVVRWQTPPGSEPSATTLTDALADGITSNGDASNVLIRAVALGERAVRLAPDDADALKALGFAYSAQGNLDQARSVYARAIDLDADAWEVMINLGELDSIDGDDLAALEWYQRAYAAMDRMYSEEPQRVGQWRAPLGVVIGQAHEARDDAAAAERWYRRVLEQAPLEPEATLRLIRVLRLSGAQSEATQLCDALNARVGEFEQCTL